MSIFGNGVISGWQVSAVEAFAVSIDEGYGNINFKAGRSPFPIQITELTPGSTQYIYVNAKERITFTEEVEFLTSTSAILDQQDFNFLKLAKVTIGATSLESIANSVRSALGFMELMEFV